MVLERVGKPWARLAAEPGTMYSDSGRGLPGAGIGRAWSSLVLRDALMAQGREYSHSRRLRHPWRRKAEAPPLRGARVRSSSPTPAEGDSGELSQGSGYFEETTSS